MEEKRLLGEEQFQKEAWHIVREEDAVALLKSDAENGLSSEEAKRRLGAYGPNKVEEDREFRFVRLLWAQISNPLVFLLFAAGGIALILGLLQDATIIFIALVINTLIGMVQEGRASRALDQLRAVYQSSTTVMRDGRKRVMNTEDIVPGDILILRAGMRVAADARILEASRLAVNEAALTGEAQAQEKETFQDDDASRPVADQTNMLFAGTTIEEGYAKALVVRTGEKTEYGRIIELIEENHSATPFQRHMGRLSSFLGRIIVVIAFLLFVVGVARGEAITDMFLVTVAVIVSVVPEGLPVAVSVILAIGMERILRQGALVRHMKSVETLGSASVILTDKTGTLTEGKMVVEKVGWLNDRAQSPENQIRTLLIAAMTSSAFVENPEEEKTAWKIHGSATDVALLMAAARAGVSRDAMLATYPQLDFFAFHSHLRLSASLHRGPDKGKNFLFVTGAPETMLAYARAARMNGVEHVLNDSLLTEIRGTIEAATARGLRLIACAQKKVSAGTFPKEVDLRFFEHLTLVGMIAFHDPLRSDVTEAFAAVTRAGVRVVMLTGDHGGTARFVAEKIGMKTEEHAFMDGSELDMLEEKTLALRLPFVNIFARVLPRQKPRIVEAWQHQGAVVAMIGDGVNDAPALKKADVGVAVGSATDIAKEVSDIVLLNDSFSILARAIREGRVILDNVRKVVTLLLSTGFTELILIGAALLGGFPIPLLPVQILWTNLVSEGLLNFAYAFEPEEGDVMRRKPASKSAPFFTGEMKFLIFAIGIFTDILLFSLFVYLFAAGWELVRIRSILFVGLVIDTIFFLFALRSFTQPFWRVPFFSNPYLLVAFCLNVLLLASAFFITPLRELLRLVPLTSYEILLLLGLGIVDLFAIEFGKWFMSGWRTV